LLLILSYNTISKKGLNLPIRLPGEWEKQKHIILVFPNASSDWKHSIEEIRDSYIELIKTIQKYQKCIILCKDKKELPSSLSSLTNIQLVEIKSNDTWIRDFGGISIYEGNKLKILNFEFNAWGEKFEYSLDNKVNHKLKNLGIFNNLKDVDFVLEGGSIDSNGDKVMLTTAKCIFNKNRNPTLSKEQITDKLKKLFGLRELIILKHGKLIGDDTDAHIDTLARFIDKDTIAYVKCYDKNDPHFEELKQMEEELMQTKQTLLPLPLPNAIYFKKNRLPATYLNFIFINSALIIPTYKDKNDEIVLKILQNFFPNKEIIGIDASIFIREHGSLHCATMNYFCYNSNISLS